VEYARRLQERLTRQIAEAIQTILAQVAVVMEATHMCMVMRRSKNQVPGQSPA